MAKIINFNRSSSFNEDDFEIDYVDDIMIYLRKEPEKSYDTVIHHFPIKKQISADQEKPQS